MSAVAQPSAPRRFLLVIQARSGGTWIASSLGSHPDLFVHEREPLNHKEGLGREDLDAILEDEVWANPACTEGQKAGCAFRVTYGAFFGAWDGMRYLRDHPEISVVLVRRWNKLAQFLSMATAKELTKELGSEQHFDTMHCKEGHACAADTVQVSLRPKEVVKAVQSAVEDDDRVRALLKESGVPFREFVYEDLMQGGFGPLLAAMHIEKTSALLSTTLVKRLTRSQSDIISNYQTVVRAVGATPFRWFLDYCHEHLGDANDCRNLNVQSGVATVLHRRLRASENPGPAASVALRRALVDAPHEIAALSLPMALLLVAFLLGFFRAWATRRRSKGVHTLQEQSLSESGAVRRF